MNNLDKLNLTGTTAFGVFYSNSGFSQYTWNQLSESGKKRWQDIERAVGMKVLTALASLARERIDEPIKTPDVNRDCQKYFLAEKSESYK